MTMKTKKKGWPIVAVAVFLAAAAIGGIYLYTNWTKENMKDTPTTVRLREYTATVGNLTAGVDATGLLHAQRVPQSFDDPVTIGGLFVQVGDTVHKGDKLAEISVECLQEKITALENRALRNKLNAVVKDYQKKQRALADAKEAKILYELNTATANKQPGPAEKEAKLAALGQKIEKAQAAFAQVGKALQHLWELLPGTTLYAQTDGIILSVDQKAGDKAAAHASVVTVGHPQDMTATLWVGQEDIGDIILGQSVECEVLAFQDTKIIGSVLSRDPTPDPNDAEGRYKVSVRLAPGNLELFDGMTCDAMFIVKQIKSVLSLSNKAIELKDGKQLVKMKNADGTLREVEIITGFSDGRSSEITSGLNPGDVVVIEG